MRALIQILVNAVGLLVTATVVPGIEFVGGPLYLLLAGLVFGLVNVFVKPIVTLFSLPFILLTLGLFFLVINGAMLWISAALLEGLTVEGCLPAILGGLVMAIVNWLARAFDGDRDAKK